MTPEVRSDDGKAPSFSPARPCVSPSWLSAGRRRPNFVAVRLAETENRSQLTWNPGDVGLISVIRGISNEDGSFLIDRLGAGLVVDQDLAVVLLNLRRRLIDEYDTGPAAMMLIDRAVSAYRDFIRVTGWTGNTALMIEAEFFGRDRPRAGLRDRHGEIRGLTVEEYINRLGQDLIPLAERCGRVMREALAALETVRAVPSSAVERSKPISLSIRW